MARPRKDYKALNVKLDSKIMERFVQYCNDLGQTKTTALERILKKHLDQYEKKNNGIESPDKMTE